MPIILVVDDSPVDRKLVGGLLEKELDWLVEFANDGDAALEKMELTLPDLVVTDLMMPGTNGLGFVEKARKLYPELPSILITGHGSEAIAVEALEKGATSYVPKSQMALKLLGTARQVLSLGDCDAPITSLISCMTETEAAFRLPSDPLLIAQLKDEILTKVSLLDVCDANDRRRFGVAIEEALLNSMLHGNLQLSDDQVQVARSDLMRGECSEVVQKKNELPNVSKRRIHVKYRVTRENARLAIADEGSGFDASLIPASGDPKPIDDEAGRGLVLIQNFMDEVRFNEAGNEIHLLKKWQK